MVVDDVVGATYVEVEVVVGAWGMLVTTNGKDKGRN